MNRKCQTLICFTDHILIMTGYINCLSRLLLSLVKQKKNGQWNPNGTCSSTLLAKLKNTRVARAVDNDIQSVHDYTRDSVFVL